MAESDTQHPDLDVPADFRRALATTGLGLDFERLPLPSRRRYLDWIKHGPDDARAARIAQAMESVRDHKDAPTPTQ